MLPSFDIDPLASILDFDLDIRKMYLDSENEVMTFLSQGIQILEHAQTDRFDQKHHIADFTYRES